MAYTNAWNETVPTGLTARDQVDDLFRQFKLDLRERIEEALIVNVAADPWVAKTGITGTVVGKKRLYSFSCFNDWSEAPDVTVGSNLYLRDNVGGSHLYCDFGLPPGVTITLIRVLVDPQSVVSNWIARKITFDASPVIGTVVASLNFSGAGGIQFSSSSALTELVAANQMYYVDVQLIEPARLYGMEVTYDTPSNVATR